MSRAVRFDSYGGPEVLRIVEVPTPVPGPGQLLVRTVVAPINPGEIGIREGPSPIPGPRLSPRDRATTSPDGWSAQARA